MGWDANSAAEIFDMTTAAVNSALQRARETMKKTEHKPLTIHLDEPVVVVANTVCRRLGSRQMLPRWLRSLREDVALTMPPIPVWFGGRADIKTFLDGYLFKSFEPVQGPVGSGSI